MGISSSGARWAGSTRRAGERPTELEKIGRAVLRLRLYHGWSQATLESRSGVDQTTISRLERRQQRELSIVRLAKILQALHADEVVFDRPRLVSEPTNLELMLFGDRWARAAREADRRLSWSDASGPTAGQTAGLTAGSTGRGYDIDAEHPENSFEDLSA